MTEDIPIIDAHHHFWDLERNRYPWLQDHVIESFRYGDYSGIRRSYLPADFFADTQNQSVVASVHMEAEFNPTNPVGETRWLHEMVEAHGFPHAIVGQAWFCNDDIEDVLAGHAAYPLSRGVRQKPAAALSPETVVQGAPGSMGDPKFREGYAHLAKHGLHYDLQTPWWHLEEAAALARDFPETPIILNHTGLPADRSDRGLAGWRTAIETFAAAPNTAVKISGLGLKGQPWRIDDNRYVIITTVEIFGIDRCMFASNYPVDGLVASYDTIFDGFKEIVAALPASDRRKLFHDNAKRYYRIDI
jgi:predicted TIM-barrel fold metal-dependent hydrolase